MQLHSRNGAQTVVHDGQQYSTGPGDMIDVPEELGKQLNLTHINGAQVWETGLEMKDRLEAEELARKRDPSALYDLLSGQAKAQPDAQVIQAAIDAAVADALAKERARPVSVPADDPAPVKRSPGRPRKTT